jgi:hypothetical protein
LKNEFLTPVLILPKNRVKQSLTPFKSQKNEEAALRDERARGIFKKTRGSPRKWGYYLRKFVHYINIVEKETKF